MVDSERRQGSRGGGSTHSDIAAKVRLDKAKYAAAQKIWRNDEAEDLEE